MPQAVAAVGAWIVANAATIALVISIASVGFALYSAKQAKAAGSSQAERKQILRSAAAPETWLYGENESAGLLVAAEEQAGEQDEGEKVHLIITHAAHPIHSISRVRLNDDDIAFFGNNAIIQHHLDGLTAADPYLLQNMPSWDTDMIGRGIAWYRITLQFKQDLFPTGLPNIVCTKKGRKDIWDPRTNTFIWSNNPALIMLHFLMHHPSLQYQKEELIMQSFIDSANICDEYVNVKNEHGTIIAGEPRYTMGAEFNIDEEPSAVFDKMLTACAGEVIRIGGKLGIQVGGYHGPAVGEITDADIIGNISIQPESGGSDTYNIVRGKLNSKKESFSEVDYPEVRFQDWITEDGEEKPQNIDMLFCNSEHQARRVAHILAMRVRKGMTLELPLNNRGFNFTPGRVFKLNLGIINLDAEYKVIEWRYKMDTGVTLVVRREAPEMYPDVVGIDRPLPPLINIPTGSVPAPSNVQYTTRPVGDVVQGVLTWQNTTFQMRGTRIVVKDDADNIVQTAFVPFPGAELPLSGNIAGRYEITLVNLGVLGKESPSATITVTIDKPATPDFVNAVPGDFSITLTPGYNAGRSAYGTMFEFYKVTKTDYDADTLPSTDTQPDQIAVSWADSGLLQGTDHYYFVRAVNSYGASDWVKTTATTTEQFTFEIPDGSIVEDKLSDEFKKKVDDVIKESNKTAQNLTTVTDGVSTVTQDLATYKSTNDQALAHLTTTVTTGDQTVLTEAKAYTDQEGNKLAQQITTVGNKTAQVEQTLQTVQTGLGEQQARYEIKTSVNQITASIGVVADQTSGKSQIVLSADDIVFTSRDAKDALLQTKPFVVTNGKVYIKTGLINELETVTMYSSVIQSSRTNPTFKIDGVTGVISGATVTAPTINGGTFTGGEFVSSNYVPGKTGFRLWADGYEFNTGGTFRGDITHATGTMRTARIIARNIEGNLTSGKAQYEGAYSADLRDNNWVTMSATSVKASSVGIPRTLFCNAVFLQCDFTDDPAFQNWIGIEWRILVNGGVVASDRIVVSGVGGYKTGFTTAIGGTNIGTGAASIVVQARRWKNYPTKLVRPAQTVIYSLIATGSDFN